MVIAMSFLCSDSAYYYEASENASISVGRQNSANIHISTLTYDFSVSLRDNEAVIKKTIGREIVAPYDQFVVLDNDAQLAVYFTKKHNEEQAVDLPQNGEWNVGRKSKSASSNIKNQIVIGLPFISTNHCKIVRANGTTSVVDVGSKNGLFLNGKRVTKATIKEGDVVSIFTVRMTLHGNKLVFGNVGSSFNVEELETSVFKKEKKDNAQAELVQITRSPRIMHEIPTGVIEIEAPPVVGSKPEINWLATFLPTVATLGIAIIMSVFFSPMMLLYSLPMTIAGVIISVTNYRRQTKKYGEQTENRQRKYDDHIAKIVKQIERKRKEQITALLLADPSTEDCFAIVKDRKSRLWERSPDDKDFASVRIGSGPIDFSVKIDIPKESISLDEDALRNKPKKIKQQYDTIDDAPVICNVYKEQICGVIGTNRDVKSLIKNIIVQLATHHCYTELKMVCVYNASDEAEMGWIKQLPHFLDGGRKSAFVATTKGEAKELFKQLTEIFKQRKNDILSNASYGKEPTHWPYYLVVILEPAFLEKNDPINEYLFMSRNMGLGCFMAVQGVEQLPKECSELITIDGEKGYIFNTVHASHKQPFVIDRFATTKFALFGQNMKTLYCDEGIAKESLPKSYSFYEMLGVSQIRDFNIQAEWAASNIRETLAAPIGIAENGSVICLDLHEKAHGPHGLVAGTTGSGKSELLQSYILSMALKYHPYEVSFVIIDFKGGGMASQVAGLPHLIGTITNIDGQELSRSLLSIEAELRRRQKAIKEYNDSHSDKVKDIYDYLDRYKANNSLPPLPHLIIVVDEFAELKAEQPEFMKELISAARIGRSLGVHLILATQKPAGQVDDQIWSNTNFQMCLKVASAADSKEVIKSDLAAHLVNPGRGYLRVGNNTIFELFQSGYSGEKIRYSAKKITTQMQEAINYIKEYCEVNNIKKLQDICLPPLQKLIDYPTTVSTGQHSIPLGEYDDPENQYQGQFSVDPFSKNIIVIGAARTGKTNMLQTMIRSLADRYTPNEINIYIIDFGSMILKTFENLNHVGGVVTPSEDEKFKNLIKLLYSEIELRKKRFFELGVSSYRAYREAGKTDLPQIVLLIDNFTGLRELYLTDSDPIQAICQSGITYGISVIVANSQTTGISYQYLSNFATRIALYCNNSTEYHVLFDKCRHTLKDIPGRCIVQKDNLFYQCQMYRSFKGEKEVEQAKAIKEYISSKAVKYGDHKAKLIPVIPETLYASELFAEYSTLPKDGIGIVLGLDYETVDPFSLDLKSVGVLAVTGRQHFGRRNFLRYIIKAADTFHPQKTEIYVVDGIDRKLYDTRICPNVKEYVYLPDQALQIVKNIEATLVARYEEVLKGNLEILAEAPVVVLMLNSIDAIEAICTSTATLSAYNNIIGKYRNMNVCIILGDVENASIPYNAPEILKKAKEERKLVLFDDIENLKVFDLPYGSIKKYKKLLEIGDSYFIKGNECTKIKTPKC